MYEQRRDQEEYTPPPLEAMLAEARRTPETRRDAPQGPEALNRFAAMIARNIAWEGKQLDSSGASHGQYLKALARLYNQANDLTTELGGPAEAPKTDSDGMPGPGRCATYGEAVQRMMNLNNHVVHAVDALHDLEMDVAHGRNDTGGRRKAASRLESLKRDAENWHQAVTAGCTERETETD